jgi:DNA helicase IV
VLDIAIGSGDSSDEVLSAADLLDAGELAARHEAPGHQTMAERAAADRTWTFGHVIVDEAQELSEMAWRLLARRCPAKSMTIVGDIAQTGGPAGATSWERVLEPLVGDRWRLARLTVNYRTPAEIMAATADLLAAIDPGHPPPQSVRETGVLPAEIIAASPRGRNDLYVAMTRSTQRLGVLHPGPPPAEIAALRPRALPESW